MAKETYRSRVYTDRPAYADYDAPAKFQAIQSIIARRLREHPNAICSYSGGAGSDIMIDLLERTIMAFQLPPIKYVFFNTGLETKATSKPKGTPMCFTETASGRYRFKPLYYVSDTDKAWYKECYGIRYSDAYEVYGMTRTGCCGCPISYKAVEDLEKIRPYEPNVVKAAWNIFGKSYEYRAKYNQYKADRAAKDRNGERPNAFQMTLFHGAEEAQG